jgi:hypothetical protein
MNHTFAAILALLLLAWLPLEVVGEDKKPVKTIELIRKDGKVRFTEKGQARSKPVTVVVGETVRWVNRDDRPHTVRSVVEIDGKPLFRSEVIPPGESRDLLFDIDLYRKAGGRTANYVRLKYQSGDRAEDEPGELIFLSAARR